MPWSKGTSFWHGGQEISYVENLNDSLSLKTSLINEQDIEHIPVDIDANHVQQ